MLKFALTLLQHPLVQDTMKSRAVHRINPVYNRKLYLSLFVIIVGAALAYLGKVTGAEWVDLSKWIVLGYTAGNTADKFTEKKSPQEISTPKAPETISAPAGKYPA